MDKFMVVYTYGPEPTDRCFLFDVVDGCSPRWAQVPAEALVFGQRAAQLIANLIESCGHQRGLLSVQERAL